MKRTLALLSVLHIVTANKNDIPSLLNDTLNQLIPDNINTAASTDKIVHIITALSTAVSLSISFLKYLFGCVIYIIQYMLTPFSYLFSTMWSLLVMKPFALFLHVMHTLYPVLVFCAAAIGCGVFIGGCAGFAAEAFSNLLIAATWGPQPKEKDTRGQDELVYTADTASEHPVDSEDDEPNQSPFFSSKKSKKALGKEPMIPRTSNSHCSSRSSSPPVIIRKIKLSPMDITTGRRKNSWQWDEEEEESYHGTNDGIRKRKTHLYQ